MTDTTEKNWKVESVDPSSPPVEFCFVSGDVLTAECGVYSARIEREDEQTSRFLLKKEGARFVDISVHHELTPSDGAEFTDEVTHVLCALIWSAVRRDAFPDAWSGKDRP